MYVSVKDIKGMYCFYSEGFPGPHFEEHNLILLQ